MTASTITSPSKSKNILHCLPCIRSTEGRKTCQLLTRELQDVLWDGRAERNKINFLLFSARRFCLTLSPNTTHPEAIDLERCTHAVALRFFPLMARFPYRIQAAMPREQFGLSRDLAERHPDLVQFLAHPSLKGPRCFFGQTRIFTKEGEPLLWVQGRLQEWASVKKKLFGAHHPASFALPHGWRYDAEGIVQKNLVKWETLEPNWQEDVPASRGKFFIELVTKSRGTCGIGRHTWMRLIDDKGGVISVGFAPKHTGCLPFESHKGKLLSPEPWEFLSGKEYATRFPLTAEQYAKIKGKIERDQREENLYANRVTSNCSHYAASVLKEVGISMNPKEFPLGSLLIGFFSYLKIKKIPACLAVILRCLLRLLHILLSPLLALIILALGGWHTDRALAALEKKKGKEWTKSRPRPFSTLRSFVDGSGALFGTGWKVTRWQKSFAQTQKRIFHPNAWNQGTQS